MSQETPTKLPNLIKLLIQTLLITKTRAHYQKKSSLLQLDNRLCIHLVELDDSPIN